MGSIETAAATLDDSRQFNDISGSHHESTVPDFSTSSTAYCRSSGFVDDDTVVINNTSSDESDEPLRATRDLDGSNVALNARSLDLEGGDTSAFAGIMMIINAALGAGLLNFPSAFHEAGGVVAANAVQFVSSQYFYIPKNSYLLPILLFKMIVS